MNDIINYIMETPENTNPAILRQKLEEYAAKNGAVVEPVFFISVGSDLSGIHYIGHYDNPERIATVQEVVDAYMNDAAYFVRKNDGVPSKIISFGISADRTEGHPQVYPIWANEYGYTSPYDVNIKGSTEDNIKEALAKYLP